MAFASLTAASLRLSNLCSDRLKVNPSSNAIKPRTLPWMRLTWPAIRSRNSGSRRLPRTWPTCIATTSEVSRTTARSVPSMSYRFTRVFPVQVDATIQETASKNRASAILARGFLDGGVDLNREHPREPVRHRRYAPRCGPAYLAGSRDAGGPRPRKAPRARVARADRGPCQPHPGQRPRLDGVAARIHFQSVAAEVRQPQRSGGQ